MQGSRSVLNTVRLALAGILSLGLLAGGPAQAGAPSPLPAQVPPAVRAAAPGTEADTEADGKAALDRKAGELGLSPANGYSCGLSGGGCVRSYHPEGDAGRTVAVYWTARTGAHAVDLGHPVGWKFMVSGYELGTYGYPTSDMECGLERLGCVQTFEHGQIDQAHIAAGRKALAAKAARLRLEPTDRYNCTLAGDGCVRSYISPGGRHISIYWSAATGARAVDMDHAVGQAFAEATYERGAYGYPVSEMVCSAGSGCRQHFQHGTITFDFTEAGPRALEAKAAALGLEPAGSYECQLAADGCRRSYTAPGSAQNGAADGGRPVEIYWSAASGAHAVHLSHKVGRKFAAAGREAGLYGYPTSGMMCSANGCTQTFQKGTIYVPAGRG
ncbi:LGFP repeat-containing protein [Arthrobacter mobilis]|uniref:LGFP repeat-containing protein n=1 Tax=Arthrobacter mobilis TaxID=2724944 RepID=A0A7X6K4E7_9MICC|nr:hypothetical protein [Arthrobacter mobilis]NKX53139.1 hypothetical protein [Arthrobacter mobilis]